MPSGRIPRAEEPADTAEVARWLARLQTGGQSLTDYQRAALEWYLNISERQDKLTVIFLTTEIYNFMRQRGDKKATVAEALEEVANMLLAREKGKMDKPVTNGKYTIHTMNVSTEEEREYHVPHEHLLDEIERLEGYNLAVIRVRDPEGNEVDKNDIYTFEYPFDVGYQSIYGKE